MRDKLWQRFEASDILAMSAFILVIKIDGFVKSLKRRFSVIPANPGSGPGQAPESSPFR